MAYLIFAMTHESDSLALYLALFLGAISGAILMWVVYQVTPIFLKLRQARIKVSGQKIEGERAVLGEELKSLKKDKAGLISKQSPNRYKGEQPQHSPESEKAIDKERLRIAHELHDDIVQRMAAVRLRMEEFSYRLDKPELLEGLNALSEEMNQIMKSLRFVIYGLPQPQFEQGSFSALIKDFLVARLKRIAGKTVEFQLENEQDEFFLPSSAKRELYHLVQEAIQNSLKHSVGFHLKLSITWSKNLVIEVTDNGQGYLPQAGASPGLGFISMEERAKEIGAKLYLLPSSYGSVVRIMVPDHFSK